MSLRLVPKSVTLNDHERRNDRYFALLQRIPVASGAHCVKKFTFAISSSDNFLFSFLSVHRFFYVPGPIFAKLCHTTRYVLK